MKSDGSRNRNREKHIFRNSNCIIAKTRHDFLPADYLSMFSHAHVLVRACTHAHVHAHSQTGTPLRSQAAYHSRPCCHHDQEMGAIRHADWGLSGPKVNYANASDVMWIQRPRGQQHRASPSNHEPQIQHAAVALGHWERGRTAGEESVNHGRVRV